MPLSASPSSFGTIVFALPWAICGSTCRYWLARLGVGVPGVDGVEHNTFWIAWASAVRAQDRHLRAALRREDLRLALAAGGEDGRLPSAVRICARLSRSARICFCIESWMDSGGSIALARPG